MDYSKIRGFNYQPSYGSTSFENWEYFNEEIIKCELRRGREYFPRANTIRIWLSLDSFIRNPLRYCESFEKMVSINDKYGFKLIPVLFNRWHCMTLDCGGVYIDNFVKGWNGVSRKDNFTPFLKAIVGGHKDDERVLAWDICNEPFSYTLPIKQMKTVEKAEYEWLARMHDTCKEAGALQPLGVSIHMFHGRKGMERINPISDLLMIHPYYMFDQDNVVEKQKFISLLDNYVQDSVKFGKKMIVTETCWGSLDDNWRVENIRFTLEELSKRNLGFIVHALHYSRVADLHTPEHGPVGYPGNLAFINADGTLRKKHDIFNNY